MPIQRPDPILPRELLVLRHAKSDWSTGASTDFDRPLTDRGRKDTKRVAAWLKEEKLLPDLVLSSPAERASETIHRVARYAGIDDSIVQWEPRIYEASLQTLLEVLGDASGSASRVLLVGHNPGLESLVCFLADPSVQELEAEKFFPTAALAHFRMPASWKNLPRGAARLLTIVRPKELS